MKDPDRLSETPDPDAVAALLQSAKRYKVSDATRHHAMTAVGLAGGSSVAPNAGGLGGKAVTGSKLGMLAAAGVAGALAAAGVRFALLPVPESAPIRATPSESIVVTPPAVESPPAVSVATPMPSPAAPAAAALPRRAPAQGSSPSAVQSADLRAELAALDAVSASLSRGEPARAMALVDAYWRNYPRGNLTLEATVLQAEALDRAGRRAEAVEQARAFLKRYPTSPLADRMKHIAGD
jgi:hypothetical protein